MQTALSRSVAATRLWERLLGPRDALPRVGAGPRYAATRRAREFRDVEGGQSIRQRPTGQGPDYVARFRGQTCLIARPHTLAHWRPTRERRTGNARRRQRCGSRGQRCIRRSSARTITTCSALTPAIGDFQFPRLSPDEPQIQPIEAPQLATSAWGSGPVVPGAVANSRGTHLAEQPRKLLRQSRLELSDP